MSGKLAEALKQIKAVFEDNGKPGCEHRLALDFIWRVADAALTSNINDEIDPRTGLVECDYPRCTCPRFGRCPKLSTVPSAQGKSE